MNPIHPDHLSPKERLAHGCAHGSLSPEGSWRPRAAGSNDAARPRSGDVARAIAEKRLSPDAGAAGARDWIFAGGLSLRDRLLYEAMRG